jgi:nucleoside-diphosphate kinase
MQARQFPGGLRAAGRIVRYIGTMQTTLIILKPDCVQRGLMGRIIERFEAKGLQVIGAKFIRVPADLAKRHYAEHEGKPFFASLIEFITSTPVMVLALRGREAVAVCRKLIGATDGAAAEPGTIRGDFGLSKSLNLVHGSDSPASAERELKLWFSEGELVDWQRITQRWIES